MGSSSTDARTERSLDSERRIEEGGDTLEEAETMAFIVEVVGLFGRDLRACRNVNVADPADLGGEAARSRGGGEGASSGAGVPQDHRRCGLPVAGAGGRSGQLQRVRRERVAAAVGDCVDTVEPGVA